jgi:hypothetical protein
VAAAIAGTHALSLDLGRLREAAGAGRGRWWGRWLGMHGLSESAAAAARAAMKEERGNDAIENPANRRSRLRHPG